MMTKAPRWATRQKAERVELKAARLAALYLLRDELGSTPKTHLAEALGISRWTYDRLLASLPAVDANIEIVKRAIKQEIAMQIQDRGNYEPAAERVENEPALYQYKDLLLETDWYNEAEHLDWVATADIAEIVDWCETIRKAEQTA